jgi:hypothetical protein
MNYIYESIFVGFYCSILYIFISPFFSNNCFLFIFGFFKHFLANYLGIHKLYCNIGYACKKYKKNDIDDKYLIIDSILEGIFFIIIGNIIGNIIKNIILRFFIIGIILHLLAELFLLHDFFCKNRCL